MIIGSSVKFAYEESNAKNLHRFKDLFSHSVKNFTDYHNRSDITFKPEFQDFFFRPRSPSNLDVVISIWIIGKIINF